MTYWAASWMDDGVFARATDPMRIHGGHGSSTGFEIERLYRDAPLLSIGEGTNDVLRAVVAKSLLAGKAVID